MVEWRCRGSLGRQTLAAVSRSSGIRRRCRGATQQRPLAHRATASQSSRRTPWRARLALRLQPTRLTSCASCFHPEPALAATVCRVTLSWASTAAQLDRPGYPAGRCLPPGQGRQRSPAAPMASQQPTRPRPHRLQTCAAPLAATPSADCAQGYLGAWGCWAKRSYARGHWQRRQPDEQAVSDPDPG